MSMFTVTESAKEQMIKLCEENNTDAVHLSVKGGGCSGFKYEWGFTTNEEMNPADEIVDLGKAKFVVDAISVMYVAGTQIDFVKEVFGSHFNISNPSAASSCGCGESFSV